MNSLVERSKAGSAAHSYPLTLFVGVACLRTLLGGPEANDRQGVNSLVESVLHPEHAREGVAGKGSGVHVCHPAVAAARSTTAALTCLLLRKVAPHRRRLQQPAAVCGADRVVLPTHKGHACAGSDENKGAVFCRVPRSDAASGCHRGGFGGIGRWDAAPAGGQHKLCKLWAGRSRDGWAASAAVLQWAQPCRDCSGDAALQLQCWLLGLAHPSVTSVGHLQREPAAESQLHSGCKSLILHSALFS